MKLITVDGFCKVWVTGNKPFCLYQVNYDYNIYYDHEQERRKTRIKLGFSSQEELDFVTDLLLGKERSPQGLKRRTPEEIESTPGIRLINRYSYVLEITNGEYLGNLWKLRKFGFKTFWYSYSDLNYEKAILQ